MSEIKARKGYAKVDTYTEKVVSAVKMGGYFDWRKFRAVPETLIVLTENAMYEYNEYGKFRFASVAKEAHGG